MCIRYDWLECVVHLLSNTKIINQFWCELPFSAKFQIGACADVRIILPYYCLKDILISFYFTFTNETWSTIPFTRSVEEESVVFILSLSSHFLLWKFHGILWIFSCSVSINDDASVQCFIAVRYSTHCRMHKVYWINAKQASNKDSLLRKPVQWSDRFCSGFLTK